MAATRASPVSGINDAIPVEAPPAASPLTGEEVKIAALEKLHMDKGHASVMLRAGGPREGDAFRRSGFDRAVIRSFLPELANFRRRHSTYRSIKCSTRFKDFEGRKVLDTQRPILEQDAGWCDGWLRTPTGV